MSDSLNLTLHNILFFGGGVINIAIALGFLWYRRRRLDGLTITFIGMSLSVAIFQISQVLGVMAPDAETSRIYFMFNLTMIPIQIFMTHWFLILIGKDHKRMPILFLVYMSGIVLFFIYILFPDTFLLFSVPKMYFDFYYNPGPLHWLMRVWFNIVGAYYFIEILVAYHQEIDPIKKNRYLFVMLAILYGFIIGSIAILLVYDIQVDPLLASFFGAYILLLAYAMIRYQLFDVRLLFQRAATYALATTVLVGLIIFANNSTEYLVDRFENFPPIIIPIVSAVLAVAVGLMVWKKVRENDLMKYEFITVIAHKFRTPLTHVRWISENLLQTEEDPVKKKSLEDIYKSNNHLIDMTGTLMELTDTTKGMTNLYKFEPIAVCRLIDQDVESFKRTFSGKGIIFSHVYPSEPVFTMADRQRLRFVFQTLIENSAAYTPKGGSVTVSVHATSRKINVAVKDTGIGIAREDYSRIFSRFYRSRKAKLTDTEGFGIGLFLAKSILRRMGGNISVSSEGENKGSTFTVVMPRTKKPVDKA